MATGSGKRGERRLVCPDCKDQRPDPLATAIVGPKTAGQLAEALGTTLEAASAWLAEGLRAAASCCGRRVASGPTGYRASATSPSMWIALAARP